MTDLYRLVETFDRLVTGPQTEPITLVDAKQSAKVRTTSDDGLFGTWIVAARSYFEEITSRQLVSAVWETGYAYVPYGSAIELPHPPLHSVVGVFSVDENGDEVEFEADNYTVYPSGTLSGSPETFSAIDAHCGRGRIELASGVSWPTSSGARPLRVRYTAGYGDNADDVPALAKAALYMLVGHLNRDRETASADALKEIPFGADLIIKQFKYTALPRLRPTRQTWE